MAEIPVRKVLLLGDGGVGKTSLVRQFCEGKFESSRVMTIGVDFQTKLVNTKLGQVKLSIWDLAGQDRFKSVRAGFYRGGDAAALVYDLSNEETLKNLVFWYKELRQHLPHIPLVLVGNKMDLAKADKYGKVFADRINSPYIKTSAASGEGVQKFFESMAELSLMIN